MNSAAFGSCPGIHSGVIPFTPRSSESGQGGLRKLISTAALLALICSMATVAAGCSGGSDKNPGTGGAPGGEQDLTRLADNFARLKSFRASISDSSGSGFQGSIEYEAPGSVHVTAGAGGVSQEIMCIGSNFYARPQGSPWQNVANPNASCRNNLGPADPDAIAASLRVATEKPLTKGAEDTVGGKKCTIYTGTLPSGVEFGVCVADGLPLRIVNRNAQGAVTLTFSDFDKPLDIKAPI